MARLAVGEMARPAVGDRRLTMTEAGATLVSHTLGEGPPVLMFASAGREASDFNELAEAVAAAGYAVHLVEAPGIGGAGASKAAPDLFDLAHDLSPLIKAPGEPVVVLGHAFGNRLARATASAFPDHVRGVVLIAAGGRRPIPEKANASLRAVFTPDQTAEAHESHVRYAFFAERSEIPDYWLRGWHGETARLQGAATRSTDSARWWGAGGKPLLVIAGRQDTIAPPEDTIDLLEAEFADRVRAVRLDAAGHALLPEKPEEIAEAVIAFLRDLDGA
ncbi:MAG: alpha/beta hydrolase [Pseudomonadota bacterium]